MRVPVVITVVVLLFAITVIAATTWLLGRAAPPDARSERWRIPAAVGAALTAWLVVVVLVAANGGFASATGGPPAVAYPLVLGVVGVLIAVRTIRPLRELVAQPLAQRGLIALHSWRVGGGVFLVLAAMGSLPALFALPAGLGDIAIALAAPAVARDLTSAGGRRRATGWAVLGLIDLVVAVTLGALSSPGPAQIFDTTPSTALLSEFPLALFPTFLVPLAMALHLLSLEQLLREPRLPSERRRQLFRGGAAVR